MTIKDNTGLVFRVKLTREEVQLHLIRLLQIEGMIGEKEEQYFTEMQNKGKHFLFEFVIPNPNPPLDLLESNPDFPKTKPKIDDSEFPKTKSEK